MSFSDLPVELLMEELLLLPVNDILNLCQTNQRLAGVCQGELLWFRLLQRDFPEVDLIDIGDLRSFYLNNIVHVRSIRAIWQLVKNPVRFLPMVDFIISQPGMDRAITVSLPGPGHPQHWSLYIRDLFKDPDYTPALLNLIDRLYPEIGPRIPQEVRQLWQLTAQKRRLDQRLRRGQLLLRYPAEDGTIQTLDLTEFLRTHPHLRGEIAEIIAG